MLNVYVFSGLGVDERVFTKINFGGAIVTHIKWIKPPINTTIQQYAQLLTNQIKSPNPTLIGLSFGGMMAIEVSKIIQTKKVIIISSIKTKYELPTWIKVCAALKLKYLINLIPNSLLTKPNYFIYTAFGIKSDCEKKLLLQIMADIEHSFLRWAIHEIAIWQNTFIPNNLQHIHGNKDGIFPINKIDNAIIVKNAGHFMVRNKATELNEVLLPLLTN